MTKIVNLFAGPGAGKSTLAAGLYYELKMRNHNVELAFEYAKDLTWEGRKETLTNQPYIIGKQYHRIKRLIGKVELVITDSPILLGYFYAGQDYPPSFKECIVDLHEEFDTLNYFVCRVKPYNPKGRNQSESEAKEIDKQIIGLLDEHAVHYVSILGTAEGLRVLIDDVQEKMDL